MESTGSKDCIQISQETADLLMIAGKNDWISPRKDVVIAKGKTERRGEQSELLQLGSDSFFPSHD